MTDLTEKWKKGELPSGWYYVQLQEGVYADNVKSIIMDYYTEFCDFMKHPYLIESVLAPVPSYEEWQELKEFADYSIHNRDELTRQINFWMQENTKLKKQLAHVTKTQAKQFRDNQKLQVKAEHAKDVVNIDTARQIKQLKKLLRKHRDVFARTLALCIDLNFGEKQKNQFADDIAEIDQVLGEGQ